ncbi:MAG: heme A synthase [Gammaproteobacteria bacterium]
MNAVYRFLSWLLPILALAVIVKGAYVRLSDAGLGCPDWPGCYGRLVVPESAAEATPEHLAARPLESGKAWREMIHRYLASSLGFGILLLAALAWRNRADPRQPLAVPLLLVPLVVFQGLLGMWTVTLLLKPLVVTAHLLGGMMVLGLLIWNLLRVQAGDADRLTAGTSILVAVLVALVALAGQIFLGGWTSANYAALACTDFPTCHASFWPHMAFREAFVLWRGLGVNYEFGVLDTPARTAIHYTHRLWALATAAAIVFAIARAWRHGGTAGRRLGWCILAVLVVQLALGISNVVYGLPLPVAVMHNGMAALLMASLVTLLFFATRPAGARPSARAPQT